MVYVSSKAKIYLYAPCAHEYKGWKYLRVPYSDSGLIPGHAYLPKSTKPTPITFTPPLENTN
jgi:hypothetical protein